MTNELRIVARPQRWLWLSNAILQLPLTLLMLSVCANQTELGMRIFMGLLAACLFALWVFALRVLWRLRAGPMELVVSDEALQVPSMVRASSTTVRLPDIEKVQLQETRSNGVSFFQLVVTHRVDATKKSVVIAQQLVGKAALDQVCEALRARGVAIA